MAHGGNSPWVASFPMSTIWIPQPITILLYLMVPCKHRKPQSGSGRWRKPQRNAFRHGLLGIGHKQNDCDVNITYWCLVGNGWEWGNGMIIDSYCGSFFHSLLSTSKIRSNSSGEILPQHNRILEPDPCHVVPRKPRQGSRYLLQAIPDTKHGDLCFCSRGC